MRSAKQRYETPLITVEDSSVPDIIMVSAVGNFSTEGEYNEDNCWEGFDAFWN